VRELFGIGMVMSVAMDVTVRVNGRVHDPSLIYA